MFVYCDCQYWYRPFSKTLEQAEDASAEEEVPEAVVIFFHAEAEDEQRRSKVLTKALKNIKWLANKRGLRNIVLHSFTHLADSKAPPEFAHDFLEDMAGRLRRTGYNVWLTPFGYVCEWELSVYGESLAKVFKEI
jgi:rubrerythrin